MSLTQAEIERSGYKLQAAPIDAWRTYDEANPIPGYFQFDWLSSRHPDLYHDFALSSVGLIEKLHTIFDLSGREIIDIGAGTGRSSLEAAQKARSVFAVDRYTSVVTFGKNLAARSNATNVRYLIGDRDHLPFPQNSFDAALSSWAELNPQEAYRVLKPDGYLIQLGSTPDALCGELTALLAPDYPWVPKVFAPSEVFAPGYPDTLMTADPSIWNGIPVTGSIYIHQFTYVVDYQDYTETALIAGRLYGQKAKNYFTARKQSTFSWRLQITIGQVRKDGA
jgi:ubiquinone/menaquinone biosynthesis C-methylase UbiE